MTIGIPKLDAFTIPKYNQIHDLLKLENEHELSDVQVMIDKELDRQSGNAYQTKYYMTYALLGLVLFLLILTLL